MLKSIDILIALSVVMLVASMAVTVLTGFVTHIGNNRGRYLRGGIADLLRLLDPVLEPYARAIAMAVLTHPLIRRAENKMGDVIHREELTKLLMELAGGKTALLKEDAAKALRDTLQRNGVANPDGTLNNIRALALQLEKSNPELSNMRRANLAILHEAETDFVAKINGWFDQTIDRVSQRFTLSTRVVTFFCGLILAVSLQIDTVSLVNRISVDDALRDSLSKQAVAISDAEAKQATATLGKNDSEASRLNSDLYKNVIAQGVISMPSYPRDFARFTDLQHVLGIIFTTLLLSLGAPFWYGALSQLVQFRSKITQDDDAQRKQRQSTQDVEMTAAGPAPVTPGILQGERGDLNAIG